MHRKKMISAVLILIFLLGSLIAGLRGVRVAEVEEGEETGFLTAKKDTIYFWYTDETMTDYLNAAAVAFADEKKVRVIPVLKSSKEYLEAINKSSISKNEATPDVYMLGNDSLGKAYLAGLTSNLDDRTMMGDGIYPQSAKDACSFSGHIIAYPFYYQTSAYLYNKTYLQEYVEKILREGEVATDGDNGGEILESEVEESSSEVSTEEETSEEVEVTPEDIEAKLAQLLPENMDELLDFADSYEAPEGVEAILKWDVSDVFYNYYFIGNSMNVGGISGDDVNQIDIYNSEAIACLQKYQELNQFFSIDADTVNYEDVLQEFIEGKIVFSVVTNDAVAKLDAAKADGLYDFEYGIMNVPAVSAEIDGRSLSITTAVVVNGYSEYQNYAKEFAEFLTTKYTQNLYARTGKSAANYGFDVTQSEKLDVFMDEYEHSKPLPKMIETSNFWINLEILFARVWNGEDIDALVKELSNKIATQIWEE